MSISPADAFENVRKVVRAHQGTAEFHDILRDSLSVIAAEMEKGAKYGPLPPPPALRVPNGES